jgi:hypothetical protein
MRLQHLIAFSLILALGNACDAKVPSPVTPIIKRSFTLTPGYMERTFNSNDMMKHGPLSLMQLSSKCVDEVAPPYSDTWSKLGIFALFSFPNFFLAATNHVVYHEFGHARAVASMGGRYSYDAGSNGKLPTDYAFGIYIERIKEPSAFEEGAATSFSTDCKMPASLMKRLAPSSMQISQKLNTWWKNPHAVNTAGLTPNERYLLDYLTRVQQNPFLASRFPIGNPFSFGAEIEKVKSNIIKGYLEGYLYEEQLLNSEEHKEFLVYHLLKDEYSILIDFAGINNQMRYAQEVADLIFKNNGHQLYFFDYALGKY